MSLPDGYAAVDAAGARGFALTEAADWTREALEEHGSLHDWAAGRPDATERAGRGRVYVVPAQLSGPDGRADWAVRHYQRGGAVASLLDDRYLAVGRPRPGRELEASVAVRARGIPSPTVVAGAVYPVGVFYRADLVTEFVPDALDLADRLFGDVPDPRPDRALAAAGGLVRLLEVQGVFHPDLNAKNVLLRDEDGTPVTYVLDLDRCRVRPPGVPAPRGPMRERLRRSLRKFEDRTGRRLPDEAWETLARGLGEVT